MKILNMTRSHLSHRPYNITKLRHLETFHWPSKTPKPCALSRSSWLQHCRWPRWRCPAPDSSACWWLNQPIWKICSSNWIISPSRGEDKKYLKPPFSLQYLPWDSGSTFWISLETYLIMILYLLKIVASRSSFRPDHSGLCLVENL